MRRLLWVATALVGAWVAASCSDDETVFGDVPPTEIVVDPVEFLGDLPCSNDPGAAKSYVAVLTDTTAPFTLAAGPPAPCSGRMAFRFIEVGHVYTAEVDVYDVPAEELFPSGGSASGSRVMLDASGAVVAPRWRTRCGEGRYGGAVSVPRTSVVVAGCDEIESDGAGTTAIEVDPGTAIADPPSGDASCAADGGAIEAIEIVPTDDDGPIPTVRVGCGDPAIVFDEGIVAGTSYELRLEAFADDDEEPTWAATCSVTAAEGITRTAECSLFTSAGSIAIPASTFADQPGFACGTDFDAFDVSLSGPVEVSVPRTACDADSAVAPVPHGHYQGTLRTYADGTAGTSASCEVDVAPGSTAPLVCSFE